MSNKGSTKTSGDRQIRRANLTFPPCPRSPRENQLASSPVSASRASAPARCTCSCQRPAPTSALGNLTQKIWARSRFVIRADFAPVPPLCYVSLKKLQAEQTSRARYLQEVRAAGSNKKWMWWQWQWGRMWHWVTVWKATSEIGRLPTFSTQLGLQSRAEPSFSTPPYCKSLLLCMLQEEVQGGRTYICNEASADYEGIGNRHRASYERRALSSFHQRPPCQRTIMLQSCAHNAKVFVNMHCSSPTIQFECRGPVRYAEVGCSG